MSKKAYEEDFEGARAKATEVCNALQIDPIEPTESEHYSGWYIVKITASQLEENKVALIDTLKSLNNHVEYDNDVAAEANHAISRKFGM